MTCSTKVLYWYILDRLRKTMKHLNHGSLSLVCGLNPMPVKNKARILLLDSDIE
jgi:hypothetical protein